MNIRLKKSPKWRTSRSEWDGESEAKGTEISKLVSMPLDSWQTNIDYYWRINLTFANWERERPFMQKRFLFFQNDRLESGRYACVVYSLVELIDTPFKHQITISLLVPRKEHFRQWQSVLLDHFPCVGVSLFAWSQQPVLSPVSIANWMTQFYRNNSISHLCPKVVWWDPLSSGIDWHWFEHPFWSYSRSEMFQFIEWNGLWQKSRNLFYIYRRNVFSKLFDALSHLHYQGFSDSPSVRQSHTFHSPKTSAFLEQCQ